jgi:hypothetical protein
MKIAARFLALSLAIAEAAAGPPPSKDHWAFKPPLSPVEPKVRNPAWIRTPVDAFILARLEQENLSPSQEADRATLLRRLNFDLLGLPPTPKDLEDFLTDTAPDAYERLVERLLASPHYGERWGRHWLDVAAYADSNGYFNADSDRPLAWKYRDYVVRAFNSDMPYDRFVREQIAGDELAGYTRDADITSEMVDRLTATHFLRNAPDGTGESDGNAAEVRADQYAVLEGTVQILSAAFLGLTVQCARCHDHKFEPITQEEYYGLQAIVKPVFSQDRWLKPNERNVTIGTRLEREANKRQIDEINRELKARRESLEGLALPYRKLVQEEALEKLPSSLSAELKKALDTKEKDRTEAMKALLKTNEAIAQIKDADLEKRFPEFAVASSALKEAIKSREAKRPSPLPQLAVATDVTPEPSPHHVLIRGNYGNPSSEVPPAVPLALCGSRESSTNAPGHSNDRFFPLEPVSTGPPRDSRAPRSSGRRLALATWITSPQNPVFARLAVNRIWQGHFGVGLVATADNFGLTGAKPTHPELLDWLATQFVRAGYSVKTIHRVIVKSATYRQISTTTAALQLSAPSPIAKGASPSSRDPDNRLLWRYPLRRLDAESLRDAMLSVSGDISLAMGGPYVPTEKTEEGQVVVPEKNPGARRRSLYLQQQRTKPLTFLDVFDGVKFNPNCAQRSTSTISLQSLALLNSDFSRARSQALAARLAQEAGAKEESRMTLGFQLALARQPTTSEAQAATAFLEAQRTQYAGKSDSEERVWTDYCQMLFASNAFLYLE